MKRDNTIYKRFVNILRSAGFEEVRSRKHAKWRHPDGRVVVFPRTPSDSRASKNTAKTIERIVRSH